jgi:hypothetical protein
MLNFYQIQEIIINIKLFYGGLYLIDIAFRKCCCNFIFNVSLLKSASIYNRIQVLIYIVVKK